MPLTYKVWASVEVYDPRQDEHIDLECTALLGIYATAEEAEAAVRELDPEADITLRCPECGAELIPFDSAQHPRAVCSVGGAAHYSHPQSTN